MKLIINIKLILVIVINILEPDLLAFYLKFTKNKIK